MKTRPWITVQQLDSPASIDAADAVQAASFILFMLSGEKYSGLQSVTEQYFCEETGAPVGCRWDPGDRRWWNPFINGWAYQITRPSESNTLLYYGNRFRLRHTPVRRITAITVGASAIDPATYQLLDGEIVSRTAAWSVCDSPIVSYEFGVDPPALGKMAARRLANELVLAASGSANCALPTGVTHISRQGIDLTLFDPQTFMDKGRTGLYEVDLFLATVNPGKARKRPRVWSPDMRRGYRS